jgi:hypothetical protein
MKFLSTVFCLIISISLHAQIPDIKEKDNELLDSMYLFKVEEQKGPAKVLHAEPLYIDLIRDLGARKGEKEWNIGLGLTDNQDYDSYLALVEYEWAPIDRLGLEIELPFSFYYTSNENGKAPKSRLQSLKLAGQYTFLVSEKYKTSMAMGYLHEFEITPFANFGKERFFTGNVFNPFFIAAKRWGTLYHTLIYAGPVSEQTFGTNQWHTHWQVNTNFHFMVSGTRNFIGVEFNKEFSNGYFDMIIRPQMRIEITEKIMIGIVTGIPTSRRNERFSSFIRLIYEPGH